MVTDAPGRQKSALLHESAVVIDFRLLRALGHAVSLKVPAQVVSVGDAAVSGLAVPALLPLRLHGPARAFPCARRAAGDHQQRVAEAAVVHVLEKRADRLRVFL